MRLRRKPWIDTAILDYADFVTPLGGDWSQCAGAWTEAFGRIAPLHVEIGVGKGDFLTELAAQHPDVNNVGLEAQQGVLYFAARKAGRVSCRMCGCSSLMRRTSRSSLLPPRSTAFI